MDYVFVIDVSADAFSSGFTEHASRSLIRTLYGDETGETFIPPCIPPQSRICIMTFDSTVHFYDISPHLERASMLVVADVEDMFVPLSNGLFIYPAGSHTLRLPLMTLPYVRLLYYGSAGRTGRTRGFGDGGELSFHEHFSPWKDRSCPQVTTPEALDTCDAIKLFTAGLRVSQQYGKSYRKVTSNLQCGSLDADTGIRVTLSHRHTLDERQYALLQSAVLYTTVDGQRRVRTCNPAMQVVMLAGNVFLLADMEPTVCCICCVKILTDLHGVDDESTLNRDMTAVPRLSTTLSVKVHNVLASRLARRRRKPKFAVARQNLSGIEVRFSDMLVEDQNNGAS
ncbi:Sec23/Sec24 trunk domain-containing protein [Cytidiella melzeri]|nr:Sec23/Sec24 trunk domain-containing protein [Cytidiella melzeri]